MDCPQCHTQNQHDASFCEECGCRIELKCSSCGEANKVTAKYCNKCGHGLVTSDTDESPAGSKFGSPENYTPKHLARKILDSKAALVGERKLVTVMFADLKGSTELIADLDPEEADKLLNPILELMMDAVHRYEGTVTRVVGDGIMALFGAPLTHEDHGLRACYSALAMHESMRNYISTLRREHGFIIQIRIGLNSGEVVVRNIGNDLYMEYTAMGQTAHLAARMEQLAIPGKTLLTADTLKLVEGLVRVISLGLVPVKGITEPVETFELEGASSLRTRMQAAQRRGLTPFVGRRDELASLKRAFQQSYNGRGQIVGTVGEPGVGKTRLFYEFIHTPSFEDWLLLETDTASWGKAMPFLPIVDLLKGYCQIEDGDDTRKIREKVSGKLVTLDEHLLSILPELLSILDIAVDDAQWLKLDPPQRRERALDAVRLLLMRESQIQPVCLVLENLHWVDSETQNLLDRLIESIPTARLLLLLNYRPEYQHSWGSKSYYTQLRLDPLSIESSEDLLVSLLGKDQGLLPLKQLLIERTEGNPFFLEEMVRTLVETQVLEGEAGNYHLTKVYSDIQLPATVQNVLSARLDRLEVEEKRLLQCAAVVGNEVTYNLLAAIADMPEENLRASLAKLQTAEFLYETSLFPEVEYTFKHALTHEVAYGTLLNEQRRLLHARILAAMEKLYCDRTTEFAEKLAHHAYGGEVWDRATDYLKQAGNKAAKRSAYQEAASYFEQALIALGYLAETKITQQQEIELRFNLRSALQPLGEHDRAHEHLRDAEIIAVSLADQDRLGWASSYLSQYLWMKGDSVKAQQMGQRALDIAAELDDFALGVVTNYFLAQGFFNIGDYSRTIDHSQRNVQALTGDQAYERLGLTGLPSVLSRICFAWALAEQGEFDQALHHAREGLSIAETADLAYNIAAARLCVGQIHLLRGTLTEGIPMLESAVQICNEWNITLILPSSSAALGLAYVFGGKIGDALALLEKNEKSGPAIRYFFETPIISTALITAYLMADEIADAERSVIAYTKIADACGFRGTVAKISQLHGEVYAHQDPTDVVEAEKHYLLAIEHASQLGMRPLLAHCYFGLGRLYIENANHKKGIRNLNDAAKLYYELQMPLWIEKIDAMLGMVNAEVQTI